MPLPHQNMEAIPFTPLTAEFLDDMNDNIESLSFGTGFEDGAIGTDQIGDGTVTLDKINGGTASGRLVSDNDGLVSVNPSDSYSTEEVDTGTTWIDGKTIYKKTITGTTSGAANADVNFSIAPGVPGFETVMRVEGYVGIDSGTSMPVPGSSFNGGATTIYRFVQIFYSTLAIKVRSGAAWSNSPYAITVYYTKAT